MVHPFFYTLKNYIYIHNYNMYNIIYNNKYTCNFIYTPTFLYTLGFPHGSEGKRICPQCRRPRFDPWVGKIPWRREWPHPGILAWRIQWREEAGGLQSMGSQRVGHDWATKLIFLNMPCFVHLNKRAKKRRAFKRLLGDKILISVLPFGSSFCIIFFHTDFCHLEQNWVSDFWKH